MISDEEKKFLKDEGYTFISEERKNPIYLKIRHDLCGKEYTCRKSKFFGENQRCSCLRKRSGAKISDTNAFKNTVEKRYPGEYTILSEYIGRKKPVEIRHKCGYQYTIKRAEYLLDERCHAGLCPICNLGSKNSLEILLKKLNRFNCEVDLLEEFKSGKTNYKVRNKKCGHEYNIRTYDVLRDKNLDEYICPICSGVGSSKSEVELRNFIKSLGYKGDKKRFSNNGKKYELDIFIEELNLGIEMNGLYWHSDCIVEKKYHLNKMRFFNEIGIRVVNIFEDEWTNKKSLVKDKLLAILGKTNKKIFGRKCEIRDIKKSEKSYFLDETHIQGNDMSAYDFGLFYEDELVAVMTFSKLRKSLGFSSQEDGVYELSRFSGKNNTLIIGGFSKLLKHAINTLKIKKIITYADLRWSSLEKNVYKENGFILTHISAPGYFYTKNFNKREHRFTYRKNNLKNLFPDLYSDDKSEAQIMSEAGYHRIYDCGNAVYILEVDFGGEKNA